MRMESIKVTFLGTGNAVPTKLRNHTAILVSTGSNTLLVDCGEGTQRQFKQAHLSPHKITHLLITHLHGDHVLGIPGLFQTLAMSNYQKTLNIYGPKGTKNFIKTLEKLHKEFKIKTLVKEVSGKFLKTDTIELEASSMNHGTPTLAFSISLKDKLRLKKDKLKKLKLPNSPLIKPLLKGKNIKHKGKTIKAKDLTYLQKGKKLTIILDTKENPNTIKLAKDSDLLITESSFSEKEKDKAAIYKHLTAKQSAQIAKKAKVKALALTHLSERYEHNPEIIEKEAKSVFKNAKLVKDFDEIIV